MKPWKTRPEVVQGLLDGDRAIRQALTSAEPPSAEELTSAERDFDYAVAMCTGREFRAFMKARRGNGSAG